MKVKTTETYCPIGLCPSKVRFVFICGWFKAIKHTQLQTPGQELIRCLYRFMKQDISVSTART